MKVLSLFSGVGGFDLGLERAGMETVALCEWDKKAAHVLRRHWPDIPIYGDVSDLTGAQLIADGVHPDLVAFGSPCQDLSVAGKRAGLAGERSGLFHEAVRIIRELRELTDGTLPRWVIWENVVGALNSNGGADFGAVLDAMADLGAVFSEWAVLDAQNFGVAQRRRRVFLVSCLDPDAARGCPDPLLPVREGGPRDLVPLRAAWKESATRSRRGASDGRVVVMRQREGKPGGGKGPLLSEESLTLATANDQTIFQPVNFDEYNATVLVPYTDLVETLTSADRHAVATVGEWWNGDDIADTVTTTSNEQRMPDKNRLQAVVTPYAVRRLLPIECERLMGWPDDWTRWDADGKEQADSHRYKQCGNGVASPVAEWVGRHIFAADAIGRAR
jgi:DNA (cytosine-5)-methyltransferase 1